MYVDFVQFLWKQGSDIDAKHVSRGEKTACKVCVTPLHVACIYAGRGDADYSAIVKKLLEWNADTKLTALSSSPDCVSAYDGLTPLEILSVDDDFRASREDLLILFQPSHRRKRKRTTPVKARAVKVGLELPPTPAGVRDQIASASPNTHKQGKARLQRHQKACQQKVQRAEESEEEEQRRNNLALRLYHKL